MLVVDDEREVRVLLRTHFDLLDGFRCLDEAAEGREAIALTTLLQPDVIVLDSMMPGMSGIEAVAQLREASPEALIVLFSAVVEASAIGRLGRVGVDAVVPKPDGLDALQRAIDELLAARRD